MKKLNALLGILVIMLLVTSCSVRVDGNVKTSRFENNVSYFQDQNTYAVFAVVAIKSGMNMNEDGVGMAYIPKSDVTPEIIAMIKNYKTPTK